MLWIKDASILWNLLKIWLDCRLPRWMIKISDLFGKIHPLNDNWRTTKLTNYISLKGKAQSATSSGIFLLNHKVLNLNPVPIYMYGFSNHHFNRWENYNAMHIFSFSPPHFFLSAKPSGGHGWCRRSHINPVQPQSSGTDTSLHLSQSPVSGRLNKLQLIGSWWQTQQAHFIAVWRQPFRFPSVGCWVLKLKRCSMFDVGPGWLTWVPCFERKEKKMWLKAYLGSVLNISKKLNTCPDTERWKVSSLNQPLVSHSIQHHPWPLRTVFLEKTKHNKNLS